MKNCDAYHICLIGELLDFIQKALRAIIKI